MAVDLALDRVHGDPLWIETADDDPWWNGTPHERLHAHLAAARGLVGNLADPLVYRTLTERQEVAGAIDAHIGYAYRLAHGPMTAAEAAEPPA